MSMLQTPFLIRYFGHGVTDMPKSLYTSFYTSWEDALWHLIDIYDIKPKSRVLLPSFYCTDVIKNMQAHGLVATYYNLDSTLQINTHEFINCIKKTKPAIVVIFHPAGIQSKLMGKNQKWVTHISPKTIVVEDCVHRVVDPVDITFINRRHFILDSWRKVVPLQGSACYSSVPLPKLGIRFMLYTFPYRLLVGALWFFMQICLIIAYSSPGKKIKRRFEKWGMNIMQQGYNVIGDSYYPSPALIGMIPLWKRLNRQKIYTVKEAQARLYKKLLSKRLPRFIQEISEEESYNHLVGFPLIIEGRISDEFKRFMEKSSLALRYELADCAWSKKRKVVYLPMGLHIRNHEIVAICRKITNFKES